MNIAIITGGLGPEHGVSIRSAEYIKENINFADTETFIYPNDYKNFLLKHDDFDLVIPIIHGEGGEDGKLQELLNDEKIKYIFSNSDVHKKCFDKKEAKKIVNGFGINVPNKYSIEKLNDIIFPIIAKPNKNGSSVGIYLINKLNEIKKVARLNDYIFEDYIEGREFTVGVIEVEDKKIVLPIMEIRKIKKVFDFNDKYSDRAGDIEIFPDNLSEDIEKKLQEQALLIHNKIGLKNMSRTDFIISKNGDIYFLEINSIPGCTKVSFIPKMIEKAGLNFSDILKYWCK